MKRNIGTVPRTRSTVLQLAAASPSGWKNLSSTSPTRNVCESCSNPANVEATPAIRPNEAYPKVLAAKEKKVEKTNCRATGKTTKSAMNVGSLCTIRSRPYTMERRVTTMKARRGRERMNPAKPEAVQNIIGINPRGRMTLKRPLSPSACTGSGKNASTWGPMVPRRKPWRKMCIERKHTRYPNCTDMICSKRGFPMRSGATTGAGFCAAASPTRDWAWGMGGAER
mmetsp:Transcript_21106/g.50910  ORF Transcript_21106/g.50910 Transcript_21106/m.50910 type:complete len:226 (-) Transcript_21106:721-1398(-)